MQDNEYIQRSLNIRKGISGTGGLYGDMLRNQARPIHVLEPGDHSVLGVKKEIERSQSSPIAYDLWYLKHKVNLLFRTTLRDKTIPQDYLDDQLGFLAYPLENMKPMCIIENIEDLAPPSYLNDPSIQAQWKSLNKYFIHLMPYEMRAYNLPEQFPSPGVTKYQFVPYETEFGTKYRMVKVDDPALFIREDYVGYLTFPCGQLGVMEVLSILKQTETEADGFLLGDEFKPILESTCDFFFAPVNDYTGQNKCFGEHMIESGYVVPGGIPDPENQERQMEWLNTWPIPFEYYEDCAPQMWIRFWIHKDDKFPVPGEFIGVLARSMALPPHIWWFQESCPFVYAGNWMETDNLTSGIVVEKILEADRTDGGFGTQYKIKVQGWDIIAYASDFMDYAVDDRVGVMKVWSTYESPARKFYIYDKANNLFTVDPDRAAVELGEPFLTDPFRRVLTDTPMIQGFSFKDMYALEELDKDRETFDYMIIPVEFYK